ncbi:hypothetical protein HMPREF1639_05060 [Peptostreptococcus sp. MV1]|uniref:hypothetical protein n=1 Tax=Peptostreptococcus sp. MV1 TaxID=1219626 RepID=UPI00050E821E|nr:hypothetical protein [Peptostreptococcus sp. MV1]KGF12835.1 hypothetical protein HMPREF1639_05060 [Peptostreptococcus sp. MV1]
MKKIIKILIGLLVLIAIIMGVLTYFLKPSDRLKNDERLWNVSDNVDIDSYNKKVFRNASIDKGKLVSEIKIDNYNFKKLLKYGMSHNGNAELQEASYRLKDDRILVSYPLKIWIWESQVDLESSLTNAGNDLVFTVESAKLGKIKMSKKMISRVMLKLKESGYGNMKIIDNRIYIKLNVPNINIRKASVVSDNLKLQVFLSKDNIINIQKEIIDTLVQ